MGPRVRRFVLSDMVCRSDLRPTCGWANETRRNMACFEPTMTATPRARVPLRTSSAATASATANGTAAGQPQPGRRNRYSYSKPQLGCSSSGHATQTRRRSASGDAVAAESEGVAWSGVSGVCVNFEVSAGSRGEPGLN